MATKEYSCVRKTKKAFERSLVELSGELPLNKITVKLICERAQLSRNAFYFHYRDINDLVADIENSLIGEAEQLIESLSDVGFPKNVYATVEGLINILDSRKETCLMLFNKTSTNVISRLGSLFCNFNYNYFKQFHGDKDRTNFDFYYMFLSNGFYGLISYWFANYEKMTKNEVTALAYILIKRLIIPNNPDITFATAGK